MISPKYLYHGIPVVDVHINGIMVPNTLIDLGATINVMTRETMLKLNIQGTLRKTTTLQQITDKSIVAPDGLIEDAMVSIDSWEYPTYFLVFHPKTKFNGYPLILGRPWLAIFDAYISCRVGNMTIKNGNLSKQLVLYPPTQPSIEHELPLWLEEGEEEEFYQTSLYLVYTLGIVIGGGQLDDDDLIDHIL